MRTFVTEASGAIGARLVPQLIDHGHEVAGIYRSPGNSGGVRAADAEPVPLGHRPVLVRRRILGSS